jgi:cysteine synthase
MITNIQNVLGGIGNTPLVELRKVVPPGSGRVVAKLEWANPTGSMKDRMASAAIERAEASGHLEPGGTVVEYTAGTTGISLAFVCAARGYGLEIVFSDAFSDEKRRTMEAFVHSVMPSGSHKIEGIGIGFVPPLWEPELVNEIHTVTTEDAKAMSRRLAREEGIVAGASSGANVVVAIRIARQLGPGATVATLIVDSGLRYLSTDIYDGTVSSGKDG